MFELRVLEGLNQGAALPLFGEQWSLGCHADADLLLNDAGVVEHHAQLRLIDGFWSVQAEAGLLQSSSGQALAQIADLALNTPFSLGSIQTFQ
ncbi:FHA domain-containing protein, partial [Pseudomonas sp. TNT11]